MTETKNGAKYIDKDPPMEEGSQSLGRKILDYLAYLKETLNFIFSNYGRRLTDANGNINELHRTATETTSRLADTEGNVTELTQRADEIESTVTGMGTDMSGMQSQITQNASAITSEVTRATAAEGALSSSITQTAGEVSIVAQKLNNIGGRNLLLDSATKHLHLFGDATLSFTDNVAVPEWGATDAIRVTGTTPSVQTVFGYLGGVSQTPAFQLENQKYTDSVYVKNNGSNAIRITPNHGGASATISPGESKLYSFTYSGDPSVYLQMNWLCDVNNSALDFIYWHPKIEYGEVATSWSPAPEDKVGNDEIISKINVSPENITISANKVDLRGYVTFTNLSTSGQTAINGGNITTGTISADRIGARSITAAKINLTDLFSQNITATNFHLTGGTMNISGTVTFNASDYTASDVVRIRDYILNGNTLPTMEDYTKYDIDRTGTFTISDVIKVRDMANGEVSSYTATSYIDIDPAQSNSTIHIWSSGTGSSGGTYIGAGLIQTTTVRTGNTWINSIDGLHVGANDVVTGLMRSSGVYYFYSDGTNKMSLDPDEGLTFSDSTGNLTASYPASIPTAVTPTYISNSICNASDVARLRLRKMGIYGWLEFNLRINSTAATSDFVTIASFGAIGMAEDVFFTLASQENKATLLVQILAASGDVQVFTQGAAGGFYRAVVPLLLTGA